MSKQKSLSHDCILATTQHLYLPLGLDPNLFEGDMILSPEQMRRIQDASSGNRFAGVISNRWPSTTIAWSASKEILQSSKAMKAINAAIAEYHAKTCLKFVRRTNEKAYFYFYEGSGCHSRVGYFGTVNKISLASECQHAPTAMHEMFHSLGFHHEQSRADRDKYVKIIWDNIPNAARKNFKKYPHSQLDFRGEAYDYLSISHYRKDTFGGGRMTIKTLQKKYQDLIGTSTHLSASDVRQLNAMYRCNGKGTLPPTLTPPPSRAPVCEDENGLAYCKPLLRYCHSGSTSLQKVLKKQCYKSCQYC